MGAVAIIKLKISSQAGHRPENSLVSVQVHFFVFNAPPEPLDEDVVQCSAAAIHADGHLMLFENASEGGTGEL